MTGRGINQGSGSTAIRSLLAVMDLGEVSARLPSCHGKVTSNCTTNQTAAGGDIQYVGAGSTKTNTGYADGWLYFGVSTYSNWANLGGAMTPYVEIDTNDDGVADYDVYVVDLTDGPDFTDVLVAALFDVASGDLVDYEPINFQLGNVDTNVFDSNTLLIPVWPAAIGVKDSDSTFPITYTVRTFSSYAVNADGDVDSAGPVTFDVVNPKIRVDNPLYSDQGDTSIVYTLGVTTSAVTNGKVSTPEPKSSGSGKPKPSKPRAHALVIHLHGASGRRAQVLTLVG